MTKYLRPYAGWIALGIGCSAAEAIFELLIPLVMSDIVDVGIATGDQGYILRKVGEAYMVMPTGPRMKEYRGMITLNETGAFLFKESQKPEPTREKLIQAAMEEYKVGEEEAAENVDSFIQQCADCHLFSQYDINLVIYNDAPEEEQEPEA